MLNEGFWTAREVRAPERNKAPAATTSAKNTVTAVTVSRILILTLPFLGSLWVLSGRCGANGQPRPVRGWALRNSAPVYVRRFSVSRTRGPIGLPKFVSAGISGV